jgi:membrane dipeptidase
MTRRDLLARSVRAGAVAVAAPMLNFGRCRLYAGTNQEYSVRSIDLVGRSLVIDMLGLLTLDWPQLTEWHHRPRTFKTSDFNVLLESGIDVFHPAVELNKTEPFGATKAWLNNWTGFLNAHPDQFIPILRAGDIAEASHQRKIGILFGMQNSGHFRTVDDVDTFYALGQRVSQLTYNSRNRIGSGCIERTDSGLTEHGFQVVERMNTTGMIVDVSHAGDHTCLDTFTASKKPVLITHSNCKALVSHPRCKSDEVITGMAKTGGVMGITGIRAFVSRQQNPTVNDVLNHFDHVVRLAGVEHVGIGSDTDLGNRSAGARTTRPIHVAGLNHARRIFAIADGLLQRGYTDRHVEAILGGNFQRAMNEVLL